VKVYSCVVVGFPLGDRLDRRVAGVGEVEVGQAVEQRS
jgi:hypothetical protein